MLKPLFLSLTLFAAVAVIGSGALAELIATRQPNQLVWLFVVLCIVDLAF